MRRKKRLCGLCPSRAWLMNKKLPVMAISWVFRTNVTADFGIVTEDFGPS